MNNLELVSARFVPLPPIYGTITGLEIEDGAYYLIINRALYRITPGRVSRIARHAQPLLEGVFYNSQEEKLFVSDGFHFHYQLERQNFVQVQSPSEAAACRYAPAQDKLAYLDVEGYVIVCDVNVEDNIVLQEGLSSINHLVPPLLNVNWGTAETQFAGFDNTTQVDVIRNAVATECMDNTSEIIWRPDGKFFLVAYKNVAKRRFKVFSVTNGIVAENEVIPGLQAPISWRLMHNMITVACYSNDTWRLVIFEGSGYAKMVVNLEEKAPVLQLAWSPGGEILAVFQEGNSEWYITLFTIGNYTFELKQKLIFKETVRFVQWRSTVQGLHHLVVVMDITFVHYFFQRTINSSGVYLNGGSTAAVIDNRHVAFLNFETFVVPPPYKQFDFTGIVIFENTINRVVFNASRRTILCIDCHNTAFVYNYATKGPTLISEKRGFVLPAEETFPLNIHHIGFFDDIILLYVTEMNCEKVLKYDLVTQSIVSVTNLRPDLSGVKFIQTKYSLQECTYFTNGDLYMNGNLYDNFVSGVKKIDKIVHAGAEYLFVLENNRTFVCNGRVIAPNVVSFVAFSQYLLYTTADHKLMSTRLDVFGDIFLTESDPLLYFDCRELEEGGLLVAGVPSKLIAILEMPRGNIETVSTDLLGIDSVNSLLSMNLWESAVNELRLRQLNPNIIVDSHIERFIGNVNKFLKAQNISNLLDFILQLKEHNVIRKMKCHFQFSHMIDTPRKIDKVCSKLLEEMEILSLGEYIEAIMITRVKLMGIQNAINYAQIVYTKQNLDVNKIVERGLAALCLYWNLEDVSAASLRTYDLDFSMFAHFIFKRDPQLTSMLIDTFSDSSSEYEKRFKINNYIGDYQTATTYYAMHMLQVGLQENVNLPLDPLIDYAQAHQELETVYKFLYEHGVSVTRLCCELGEHFESINRKSDAAEMYAEGGDLESALTLHISILEWEKAIHVINLMNLAPDEQTRRLEALADHLDASGVYDGAITTYVKLENYTKAIDSCLHAHLYCEAVKLADEHQPDRREYIKQHLLDYVTNLLELICCSKNDISRSADRVELIWQERIAAARTLAPSDSGQNETGNECAESVRTGASTGRTFSSTTSRKTRKEERRYVDLKPGGPYEDIAIMRMVHNKVTELCKMKGEVDDLTFVLTRYDEQLRGKYLESVYSETLGVFRNCISRIWFLGLNISIAELNEKLIAARKNLNLIEEKYRHPPIVGHQSQK